MTRLAPIDPAALDSGMRAAFDAVSPRDRMLMTPTAHAPGLMTALHEFAAILGQRGSLPGRLVELVRLRIAFHNQCRSCMAMRYQSGLDDGITDDLVCSLEKPQDAPDLTEAERAAIAYADISATDHFAISDRTFADLRPHFTEAQIVELGLYIAYFIGFGRLVAAWDLSEELPGNNSPVNGPASPWSVETFTVQH
jgi:AhpD family alkylhydroperoxidase